MELVSVTTAAKELNLSENRVRQLIKNSQLPAQKPGREWIILRKDLEEFKLRSRRPGRPRKEQENSIHNEL